MFCSKTHVTLLPKSSFWELSLLHNTTEKHLKLDFNAGKKKFNWFRFSGILSVSWSFPPQTLIYDGHDEHTVSRNVDQHRWGDRATVEGEPQFSLLRLHFTLRKQRALKKGISLSFYIKEIWIFMVKVLQNMTENVLQLSCYLSVPCSALAKCGINIVQNDLILFMDLLKLYLSTFARKYR